MQKLITGQDVWAELSPRLRKQSGRRRAAIAFVTKAAEDILGLRAGDEIVVNASKRALRAGATDPAVLRAWLDRKVKVHSHDSLHAKIVTAGNLALVGSANASFAARGSSYEAVLLTDNTKTVGSVNDYISQLAKDAATLDHDDLDRFDADYQPPRRGGLTGVTSRAPASTLLPEGPWTLHVEYLYRPATRAGEMQFDRDKRSVRSLQGLHKEFYELDATQGIKRRPDDLAILLIPADDTTVEAYLGRIHSNAPRRSLANVYYYWHTDYSADLDDLNAHLVGNSHRGIAARRETIRDQDRISTILSYWGLP